MIHLRVRTGLSPSWIVSISTKSPRSPLPPTLSTISDAVGPVDVALNARTATITYTMKGGMKVVQTLELQGDGRTLSNHVTVKKFGMKFASVDGKIRKVD